MPTVDIHNVGRLGIIRDVPDHLLPPEAWSDGRNVRCADNKVSKIPGYGAVFDPPTVAPYWLLLVRGPAQSFWIYTGLTKAYVYDGTTHTDITRTTGGDYGANADDTWNGGLLGGIPILNNGADNPQYWTGIGITNKLADLTNWPLNTTAQIVRPFKNFLIALNITETGVNSPYRVLWSDAADPGSLPPSWDVADPTTLAGEFDLTTYGSGPIIDQLQLRDINIIYKENATIGQQLVGGTGVFRFFTILESSGLLGMHCVSIVGTGEAHFLHNGEDIILFDGQSVDRIINNRMTRWLQQTISSTAFRRSFVTQNIHNREMLFCFPEEGQDWPNLALSWSWVDGTIGVRELSPAAFVATGVIVENEGSSWDSDTEAWDSDLSSWDTFKHKLHERRMLQADPVASKLYFLDDETTNLYAGAPPVAFIERTGLAIAGSDRRGEPKVNFDSYKTATRLWPKMTGGPVRIRVGGQEYPGGPITWSQEFNYDPATQRYLDFFETHRLLALRIESSADVAWELEGYELELDISSEL